MVRVIWCQQCLNFLKAFRFNSLNGASDIMLKQSFCGSAEGFNSLIGASDISKDNHYFGYAVCFNSLNGAIDTRIVDTLFLKQVFQFLKWCD